MVSLSIRGILRQITIHGHIFGILSYMKSLSLSQPHLLITVGIPGSGKSTFAEKFAATFNAPFVDYSQIMEIAGQNTNVSDAYAGYLLKELFKTGHTIIFDGPTATRAERSALKDLAATAGYKSLFIWTQTDKETAKARFIKEHRKSGRIVTGSQYDALLKEFSPPNAKEHPTVVVSGKHTYATQAKAVLKNLTASRRPGKPGSSRDHASITVHKRNITTR